MLKRSRGLFSTLPGSRLGSEKPSRPRSAGKGSANAAGPPVAAGVVLVVPPVGYRVAACGRDDDVVPRLQGVDLVIREDVLGVALVTLANLADLGGGRRC